LLILARLLAENPAENLTVKQVEYAKVIHSSGSDLLLLINDILDLSRVEAGKLDVHPERFALTALAEDLRTVFEPLAAEKELHFAVAVAPDVPDELVTDRQRLRQVLHNLLSNAVKFTQQGTVELRIGLAGPRSGGPDDVVAFSVTDTGIGISDDSLKTIFEAFQQGDGTTSRRYGGTGLGLAISRDVAAVLGGRITAQSQPGSGSTFTLYLPVVFRGPADGLAAAEELASPDGLAAEPVPGLDGETLAPAVPVTGPGAYQGVRGKKVLIVDDDLRNAFAISSVLELYGLSVSHAPGGRQGIEALRADPGIDLVLMDVMMPEMDGYSTTAVIREMAQFADLPVIVVTARAMPGDRDKALAAGASDYVTKPVDTDELLSCITRWLARGATPG